jgi:hypothetical protein
MQGHEEAKIAKKEKDSVSRVLAIASLALSIFTFYYASLDERYYGTLSVGARTVSLTYGDIPTASIDGLVLTFLNSGNRPISVEGISYSAFGLGSEPTGDCYESDDSKAPVEVDYNKHGKILQGLYSKSFEPFTIKAGESETRSLSFSGPLLGDAFGTIPEEKNKVNFAVGCLYVQFNTLAKGRQRLAILAAEGKRYGDALTRGLTPVSSEQVLVGTRWPLYLISNLIASWRSEKPLASDVIL